MMKRIENYITPVIKAIFNREHPYFGDIMFKWKEIVGIHYNDLTNPITIKKVREKGKILNVLYVEVVNSSVSMEISYRQDIIIERIAIFFGNNNFKIHKLRIININKAFPLIPHYNFL